jgi:nucleotide-binding universal stress UspA family protein
MSKLKVLVPLDGSGESMHSLDWLKNFYSSEAVEITLLNVMEVYYTPEIPPIEDFSHETARKHSMEALNEAEKQLEGYTVNKLSILGSSADVILNEAKQGAFDMIVMAKSNAKGLKRLIGSVTSKVVRDSEVAVIVVPQ